jgi:hypothetical protein
MIRLLKIVLKIGIEAGIKITNRISQIKFLFTKSIIPITTAIKIMREISTLTSGGKILKN